MVEKCAIMLVEHEFDSFRWSWKMISDYLFHEQNTRVN
jgi:hypothetical protein